MDKGEMLKPNKIMLFGRVRAGARVFSNNSGACLACGDADGSISHILRRCHSTRTCLNAWVLQLTPTARNSSMKSNDDDFV